MAVPAPIARGVKRSAVDHDPVDEGESQLVPAVAHEHHNDLQSGIALVEEDDGENGDARPSRRVRFESPSHASLEQALTTLESSTMPVDDDATPSQLLAPTASTSDSILAVVAPPSSCADDFDWQEIVRWIAVLEQRSGATEVGVTLSHEESQQLVQHLRGMMKSHLEQPATRSDLLQLVKMFHPEPQASMRPPMPPQGNGRKSDAPKTPTTVTDTPAVDRLPADVILIIIDHLRAINGEKERGSVDLPEGVDISTWQSLRSLSRVNKKFRSVCSPLYRAELHSRGLAELPKRVRFFEVRPARAQELTSLYLYLFDFEDPVVNTDDYGFVLPDLLRLLPNVRTLSIRTERFHSHNSYRRRRDVASFDAFTGGVHLPELIVECLPSLRELVYGAAVLMGDIARFLTLPELRSLEIVGQVDRAPPPKVFASCLPKLRRFWCPTATFSVAQLSRLVANSMVSELAFVFDLEKISQVETDLTPEEVVAKRIRLLEALFKTINPQLRELRLNTPFADEDFARGPNGGFPPILQAAITVAFPNLPFPAPGGPAAPAAAQQGAAGGHVNPNANIMIGAQVPGIGAGAAPAAAVAAAAPVPLPQAAAASAAAQALPPQPQPPPQPPRLQHRQQPQGLQPLQQQQFIFPWGGAGGGGINAVLGPQDAPRPFFESIVTLCHELRHLELYGRRYGASLVTHLARLPLRHLSLSIPTNETERIATIEQLQKAIEDDSRGAVWKTSLKRVELSGRGGEWQASERRSIKLACEKHGIAFASTDVSRY